MDVTLADDTKVPNDVDSRGAEHVVVFVREGLGWRNDNRITSVCTKRIKVLHVAADDSVLAIGLTISTESRRS